MKFTVACVVLLSISSTWAITADKRSEDQKDHRVAREGYPSTGHSTHTLQFQPSHGHDDGNAISISAGYSVGGGKPQYSFAAPSQSYYLAPQGLSSGDNQGHQTHQTIQLQPISVQPEHGSFVGGNDLSQLMSQLSHGLSTGAISLQSAEPSYHGGAQEVSIPQYAYATPQFQHGAPQFQQYNVQEAHSAGPSYAAGIKGLSSYGSTGPVLFTPSSEAQSHASQPALQYVPSSGHSFGDSGSYAGLSLGGSGGHSFAGSGHSFGGSEQSLGTPGHSYGGSEQSLGGAGHSSAGSEHSLGSSGLSLGGHGHSFGGSGHSLGNAGLSLVNSGHSFGGPIKSFGGSYAVPSKNSFKPSAFLGTSAGDSTHGLSGLSASYGSPSFGHSIPGGHGFSLSSGGHSFGGSLGGLGGGSLGGLGGGSLKFGSPSYAPAKSGGLESVSSFSSGHSHLSSPPRTTYGVPSGSYDLSSSPSHSSSSSPQYYISSSKGPSSGSYEGASHRSPVSTSIHSSLQHHPSPKYNFGSRSSASRPRHTPSKDIEGAYSENTYNTIRYSEELKPRA